MSEPLRVMFADDEAMARRRMRRLLDAMPNVEVVGEHSDGAAVLESLGRDPNAADVLLLDIRMPGLTGLEARAMLPDDGPHVVFTTAYSEHALRAYEVGAKDYLLKPIDVAKLSRSLSRARQRRSGGSTFARKPAAPAAGRRAGAGAVRGLYGA